jgi:CelD/BcsL family acetyltransferase involved in cellulose biosynthesis
VGLTALGLGDRRWLEFVESRPAAPAYHHPAWAGLLADCYGYAAFALAVQDAAGAVQAGLPVVEVGGPLRRRRWVSLPFTDECPLLGDGGSAEARLLAGLDRTRRDAGVAAVEVRAPLSGLGARADAVAVTHHLGLDPDPDVVVRGFRRSSVRRAIKRATREGVVVERAQTPDELTSTYYDLHVQTRRRQGVPAQPRRYFELLWERMIEPGLGFVLLARVGTTPVAGAVYLAWKDTVTYKYGASDAEHWQLRPNHLVMWEAIRWACEHGYRTLDLGRSDLANTGLREYKDHWGADEAELVYTTVGGGAAQAAGQGRLHDALGAVLRRSPPLACRLVGELLYRYAA